MSITVTSPTSGKFGFILNGVSSDASGCELLKAAPTGGQSIYIDHLTINNGADAISVTIGEGETTPGSVDTALIGPIAMAVNTSIQFDFPNSMKLTPGKPLVIDASGAGAICVFAYGKVR